MLKPNKYTDIDLSVIGLTADILKQLMDENIQRYDVLLDSLVSRKGQGVKENFSLSLVFLFALGKIKYHNNKDIIELLD